MRFKNTSGEIRGCKNRLYPTKQAATDSIPKKNWINRIFCGEGNHMNEPSDKSDYRLISSVLSDRAV